MRLANQVAIVTGASTGIGEAMARLFAREGARVALAARSADKLAALEKELGSDRALAITTDVTKAEQIDRLIARTVERFGRLDILVNNAGQGLYGGVEQMEWESFREMWEVNFFAAVRATRAALPHLERARGVVVNISSVAGKLTVPYMAGYCATKCALNSLSTGLRMELAEEGVHVATVCPGPVETPFHLHAHRSAGPLPKQFTTERRRGRISAEEVAEATLRAVVHRRREVVVPWTWRLAIGLRAVVPGLSDAIMRRVVRP